MTSTSSRSFKKLSSSYASSWMNKNCVKTDVVVSTKAYSSLTIPRYLPDPSWARQTVNATKLGAEPACVVSENQWKGGGHKCINENDKSNLQEDINSMCVSCVLTQVLAISWKKRHVQARLDMNSVELQHSVCMIALKRLNYERSVKTLCILRFCGEAHVTSTIPRKHQTCHWFLVGSAYIKLNCRA